MWLILALLYCVRYRNNKTAPANDIISPLITLSLLISVYDDISLVVILILEAIADYYIGSDFKFAVILFGISHAVKQLIMLHEWYSITIFIVTCLMIIGMIRSKINVTEFYALCLGLTLLQTTIFKGTLFNGFLLFVISDLMILLEDHYPRRIRIWTVPLLYWTSQYLMTL